jgi:hypothetical protein
MVYVVLDRNKKDIHERSHSFQRYRNKMVNGRRNQMEDDLSCYLQSIKAPGKVSRERRIKEQ